MKNRILLVFLVVILAVSLVLSAGCSKPVSEGEAKTLKIGAIACLTGWAAPGEVPANEGAVLAVDWINEKGGITVNGETYLLKLVTEDMKSTAEDTIAATNKLVHDQKVKFIVGGVVPFMSIAASSVTEPAGVLRIDQYNVSHPDELGPKTPLTFAVHSTYQGMRPVLTYLKETHPEVETLFVMHCGDGGEPYLDAQIIPIAEELGLTFIGSMGWPPETMDFTPVVARALEAKPDALMFTNGWAFQTGSMLGAARKAGFEGPVFACNVEPLDEIIEYAGLKEAEGYFLASWNMQDPKMPPIVAEIIERGKQKFGQSHHWHLWGWNTIWTLVQAIESAQSLDPIEVAEHWRTMETMETPYGTATIGGLKTFGINNIVTPPVSINQVVDGTPKIIKWVKYPTP